MDNQNMEEKYGVIRSTPAAHATHTVSQGPQLVERLDVEPGSLVPRRVQRYSHGVLLQQCREPLVHSQVFIAFQVQQLSAERKSKIAREEDKVKVVVQVACREKNKTRTRIAWREISHSLAEICIFGMESLLPLFIEFTKSLKLKWFSWPLWVHPRVPTPVRNIYHLSIFMEPWADLDKFHISIPKTCACNQWSVSKKSIDFLYV